MKKGYSSKTNIKKSINSKAIAAAVVGSWDGLGVQAWFDPEFNIEKTSKSYMDLLISGMLANEK